MHADSHHNEYLAAARGMRETYGRSWTPAPGDRVRCPRAFGGGYQAGTVHSSHRSGWLVDTAEGRLVMFTDELERIT